MNLINVKKQKVWSQTSNEGEIALPSAERTAYTRILNCEVYCAQFFGIQTKIRSWCTVQVHAVVYEDLLNCGIFKCLEKF